MPATLSPRALVRWTRMAAQKGLFQKCRPADEIWRLKRKERIDPADTDMPQRATAGASGRPSSSFDNRCSWEDTVAQK